MNKLIVLENDAVKIAFEKRFGRLVSLYSKVLDLEFISDKRLADNYRILVPREGVVDNYILGREQKLSSYKINKSGVTLLWEDVSARTGKVNIRVALEVILGPETGDVSFTIKLENEDGLLIEEVNVPILGGVIGIRNREKTEILQGDGGGGHPMQNIFRKFPFYPYWAVDRPFVHASYPGFLFASFLDITNGKEGLYIGIHDKSEQIRGFQMILNPCYTSEGKWPEPPLVAEDVPVGGILFPVMFPFFKKRDKFASPPVICRFHSGIFEEAAKRHRKWLDTWFRVPKTPDWFRNTDAWLTISMASGSDRIYYRYSDLPRIAERALKCGVTCFHIQGHDIGGQDRKYPRFDEIDPRLGTEKELIESVKKIHNMGMKVIFFMKINKADITDPWFKKELSKYAIKNRYGEILSGGCGYGTTMEISTQNIRKMAYMCPYVKEWQDIIIEKSKYVIEKWSGDGIQFDETCGNNVFCFDETHRHNPSVGVNKGILELLKKLRAEISRIRSDVVIGGEALSDIYFQEMDFSYARYWCWHHNYAPPVSRYMLPEAITTACIDYTQYDGLNYALMNGHFFALEPKGMHGIMEDFRDMLPYVKEIIKIRKEYRDYLWDGRFVCHEHVRVSGDLMWGVFEKRDDVKSLAVVLMNRNNHTVKGRIITKIDFKKASVRFPFKKERVLKKPYETEIPGQSIAVVLLKGI